MYSAHRTKSAYCTSINSNQLQTDIYKSQLFTRKLPHSNHKSPLYLSALACSAPILWLFELSLRTLSKRRSRCRVLRANNAIILPKERQGVGVRLLRVLGCRKGRSLGNIKVNTGWNLIDNGTQSLEMSWHPGTINTLGELVRRPFVFAIQSSEIKPVDRVS